VLVSVDVCDNYVDVLTSCVGVVLMSCVLVTVLVR
jgi:hypothetical protein